jgi:hypothetical protein
MKTVNRLCILAMLALVSRICCADDAPGSLHPKEYVELHDSAANPKDAKWADSMRRLATVGDAFTVEHLKVLDGQKLDARQGGILKDTLAAVRERMAKEDLQTFTKLIQTRLERAGWADLMCDKLEGKIVPWTLKFIQSRADSPEVVAELKRIHEHYVPSTECKTWFSSMRERVPSYAAGILAAKSQTK